MIWLELVSLPFLCCLRIDVPTAPVPTVPSFLARHSHTQEELLLKQFALQVLGVSKDAEQAEAKRQYRKLAALVHPDKCALEGAEEAFKLLAKSAACLTSQGPISRLVWNRITYTSHCAVCGNNVIASYPSVPGVVRDAHACQSVAC